MLRARRQVENRALERPGGNQDRIHPITAVRRVTDRERG